MRSSFRAKASASDSISQTHDLLVAIPHPLFHPINIQSALWKPKCCVLSPTFGDANACIAKLLESTNSLELLKEYGSNAKLVL